ncbi:Cu-Zn family superoxide dismutase [Actinoalloteichus hoggarensis]|nr:superoxide dismutase family protein [Actinoalloteichus hoggarensis]MBB5922566.1 Cu-Zn family superoxide dismutase [Actinoalloteichus hoggarensis]
MMVGPVLKKTTTALTTVLAVCGLGCTPAVAASPAPSPAPFSSFFRINTSTFVPPPASTSAVTYDPVMVPPGAKVAVTAWGLWDGRTNITFGITGLIPGHAYGAHLHESPCGDEPADAGSHYQHVIDPVQPSVDPAYANPRNEVWLDFVPDSEGEAVVMTSVGWRVAGDEPRSVVIHAEHTATGVGEAGTAGERLACVTVRV